MEIKPVLKWVGGKRQLLPELQRRMPEQFGTYCEPFIGGAALLLAVKPQRAIVCDFNAELINFYSIVKNDCENLILELKQHKNESDYFYSIRGLDRDAKEWAKLTPLKRASRFAYLNKTCFNGLYRVNAQGQVNTPFGRYKNPNICPEDDLRAMSAYLNSNDVTILCNDYRKAVETLQSGDFVYFDPPYDPVSPTASYTGYTANGFTRQNQIELCETCKELDKRGVKFMLSNSATDFIKEIYSGFNVEIVKAKRAINCKGDGRQPVDEVIVRNYG